MELSTRRESCFLRRWVDNSTTLLLLSQGIINWTATETFVKEPELGKLLRELKSVLYNKKSPCCTIKKVHLILSHVCNGKFAVFWVLCCGCFFLALCGTNFTFNNSYNTLHIVIKTSLKLSTYKGSCLRPRWVDNSTTLLLLNQGIYAEQERKLL